MSFQRSLCSRAIARVGSSLPLLQQSHKNVAFLFFLLSGQTLFLTAVLGETLDERDSFQHSLRSTDLPTHLSDAQQKEQNTTDTVGLWNSELCNYFLCGWE